MDLTSLSPAEFAGLYKYVSDWRNVFFHFDRDRSGSIEGRELAEALRNFGYNLSPPLLALVEQKYGKITKFMLVTGLPNIPFQVGSGPVSRYGPPPGITFDRFVRACVVVKTLTEAFQK
jgi:hypothetical protein